MPPGVDGNPDTARPPHTTIWDAAAQLRGNKARFLSVSSITSRPIFRFTLACAGAAIAAKFLPVQDIHDGWSLFPPLVAIGVSIATGRLLLGLSCAVLGGAWLTLPQDISWYLMPITALEVAVGDFVWSPLRESFQLYILGFTAALIGMVRVVALAGGTQGIADLLVSRAAGAQSTRVAALLMGLAIFFDDYANSLVTGTTMRPIADRFGVSREKLAYLVDSTAAPIAGIAIISTWIGYEVGLFADIMRDLGTDLSGYELFFRALPARFYCILTLIFVTLSTLMRRDFGPMLAAERRASSGSGVLAANARPMSGSRDEDISPAHGIRAHWGTAIAPVGVVIFGVVMGMYADAYDSEAVRIARTEWGFNSRNHWIAVFSNADNALVMFLAAMAGSLLAFALALTTKDNKGHRPLSLWRVFTTWVRGITGFYYAIAVLVLAWAIKETCNAVGTSDYLIASLTQQFNPNYLPVIVFLLSAVVAFAIGTSWTTMAILLPTTLPLAFTLGNISLVVLVAAAVLDGAIFGDHCSPISDTTVLSSIASGSDHLHHVRTQLPYAVTTMAIASLCGYLGASLFYDPFTGIGLGTIVIVAILLCAGSDPESEAPVTKPM